MADVAFHDMLEKAKDVPWYVWAGGAVAILFFGSKLLSNQQAQTSASADSSGSGTDTTSGVGDIGTPGPTTGDGTGTGGTGTGTTAGSPTGTTTTGTTNGSGTTTTSSKTYTVRQGDTLNSIASREHVDEPALYAMNQSTIEATAKAHNFPSSDGGHWIFPGEILKIPA